MGYPKIILFILVFFLGNVIYSQQPSYFKLGEEELSGVDIYDIIQDKNDIYWLATDHGIIRYDTYNYTFVNNEELLGSSVFDLKLDRNGIAYAKNFSGQIIQLIDESCRIYYQLPDSVFTTEFSYDFDDNNQLIVVSNAIYKKEKNHLQKLTKGERKSSTTFYTVNRISSGKLITHEFRNSIIYYIGDDVSIEKFNAENTPVALDFFELGNQLYSYDFQTSKLYQLSNGNINADETFNAVNEQTKLLRYYSTNDYLWVARPTGGVKAFNNDLSPLFGANTLFNDEFISTVYKDKEGNFLLGTFGNGIIVVPNLNFTSLIIPESAGDVTKITSGNNTLFFGTTKGKIYQYNLNAEPCEPFAVSSKHIDMLEYLPHNESLLFDDKNAVVKSIQNGNQKAHSLGSIKDIYYDSDDYFLATNRTIVKLSSKLEQTDLKHFRGRTNCVGYNPDQKIIYAGTMAGLKIGNEENCSEFTINNKPIVARDILTINALTYITTKNKGLLIFSGKKLIKTLDKSNSLPTNGLNQLKHYNNYLYINSDIGIIQLELKSNKVVLLNQKTGLNLNNVSDMEILDNQLWLVHRKGITGVPLSYERKLIKPELSWGSLSINDSVLSAYPANLNYDQNKITFSVVTNSIAQQQEINYLYRLSNIDSKWQQAKYHNNSFSYKSLSPGNYTFQVKLSVGDEIGPPISYDFSIDPPLWETWWFYTIIVLLFLTGTTIIYKVALNKQRTKIKMQNELNASKLIAIQSQMNPHFIFNAINSIQDLILQGDIDNSYSYIIKFSKLVRQTLDFSDKEFIDIENELELLNIYLTLEKLRFKEDFSYKINSINLSDIKVPPMLIQPFVENAIKHGLLHKEGDKLLNINFEFNDNTLICTVADNGIGRKKAKEIKERKQIKHKSFSVNATENRFKIMKDHYKENLSIRYVDLHENGNAVGTEVIIQLPFITTY